MSINLNKLTKKVITSNQYFSIASTNEDGSAWISPVAYCFDKKYSFYFVSLPSSQHAQNFLINSKVSFAIFDSQQVFGEGIGLQIEGVVEKVTLAKLPKVISLYASRSWPFMNNKFATYLSGLKKLLKNKSYLMYQITPVKIWMNDPNASTDVRVEINLKQDD